MGEGAGPRVAIVGAGLMGRWHAYFAARAGAEIAAIIDRDPRAADALRARYPRARGYRDLATCLAHGQVDVAHICTPLDTHVALATVALEARKHVLIEKPLAPTAAETERLLALAAARGVMLCPVHQFPFQRGCRRLRRQLPRLGEPVFASFMTCSAGGAGRPAAGHRALLFEILPHPLSLFQAVLGVDLAHATIELTALTDDALLLHGQWRGMQLQAAIFLRGRPTRNALSIIGSRATAHVDLFHGYLVVEAGEPSRRTKLLQPLLYGGKLLLAAGTNLWRRAIAAEVAYPGLDELIGQFYCSCQSGTPPPIAAADILALARVIDRLRDTPVNGR